MGIQTMATSQEQILTCKLCYFRNKGWAMRCTPPISEYLSRLVHTSHSKQCYWSNKFLKPQAFFWPWQSTSKPVELRWAAKIHNFRFRFQWVKSLNSQPSQLTCHVGLLLRKQGAVPGSQDRHRFTFEMRRFGPWITFRDKSTPGVQRKSNSPGSLSPRLRLGEPFHSRTARALRNT